MIYRTRVNLCIHKSVSSPVHEEHLPDHVDKVEYLAAEELQEVEGVLAPVLLNIYRYSTQYSTIQYSTIHT